MGNFKGKINWYDSHKKYGYVKDGYGNEYFFHRSGIKSGRKITIVGFQPEDEVEFDLIEDDKGKHAVDLVLTKKSENPPKKDGEKKSNKKEKIGDLGRAMKKAGITEESFEDAKKDEAEVEAEVTSAQDTE